MPTAIHAQKFYPDMHIRMPRQSVCIYTTSQDPCWDIFTATRRRRLREAIVGKYRIPNPNDVFVYYEPALTIFLDDRAQYEALLARKDEVVRDVYTLIRGKFPLDKLEKLSVIRF